MITIIAGCTDDDSEDDIQELPGEEYPPIEEWLTDTEYGSETPNFDGTVEDHRSRNIIHIDVGAGETASEFEPAAVTVSAGTTVRWVWTGHGGLHNILSHPGDGEEGSFYDFSSGDPVDAEGVTFEVTLNHPVNALYYCEPHLSAGMKGAIVVE